MLIQVIMKEERIDRWGVSLDINRGGGLHMELDVGADMFNSNVMDSTPVSSLAFRPRHCQITDWPARG